MAWRQSRLDNRGRIYSGTCSDGMGTFREKIRKLRWNKHGLQIVKPIGRQKKAMNEVVEKDRQRWHTNK